MTKKEMTKIFALALCGIALSACSASSSQFESDYWFGRAAKEPAAAQPRYIPIAAVPPRPQIKWTVKGAKKLKSQTTSAGSEKNDF